MSSFKEKFIAFGIKLKLHKMPRWLAIFLLLLSFLILYDIYFNMQNKKGAYTDCGCDCKFP
jgi:hypothetical protein